MPTIITAGAASAHGFGALQGKSIFTFNIAGGQNVNLSSAATTAGWNGSSAVIATVTANIGSTSVGSPALLISGSFPGGVRLNINSGIYIVGCGGAGGTSSTTGNGGPAIQNNVAGLIVNNQGIIGGGGGGGYSSGGAGGGGAGYTAGTGYQSGTLTNGGSGATSSCYGTAGAGGAPGSAGGNGGGGGGGGLGASGGQASSCYGDSDPTDPGGIRFAGFTGTVMTGGAAVLGTGSISWVATGTRYGTSNQ